MSSVLLDLREIKIMSIIMLAKNMIQNANPKKAVHTKTEGLISGHKEQRKDDNKAAIPQMPIIALPNPCKKVFLLFLSFAFSPITTYFLLCLNKNSFSFSFRLAYPFLAIFSRILSISS